MVREGNMVASQQEHRPEESYLRVESETGPLEGVVLHTPGPETENMTPENAERALYSDILNLAVGAREYAQLRGVLQKVARTWEVKALLADILHEERVRRDLVERICAAEDARVVLPELLDSEPVVLARKLLEGVVMPKNTLSRFLSPERYALRPLHNFFFTRDAAMILGRQALVGKMASRVRGRESVIQEAIFTHHPDLKGETVNPQLLAEHSAEIAIEGGDVLVARKDVLLIGIGSRTTPEGVDFILDRWRRNPGPRKHILVQELPRHPESFIHLDMVFTFLDRDLCMIYEPVILQPNRFRTVHIEVDNGRTSIREEQNLLTALSGLGMEMEYLCCGGQDDTWIQEREQWHSGANFFAFGPGRVLGYARNVYTIDGLIRKGFEVIRGSDVLRDRADLDRPGRVMVAIDGSELSRGGGGCRCMTLPVRRSAMEER